MKYFNAIGFIVYAGVASYDYSIGSKWTLAWCFLSIATLFSFGIEIIFKKIEDSKPNITINNIKE
jgi:hypothetical protein